MNNKLTEGYIKRWLSRNDRLIRWWANKFRSYEIFSYDELYQIAYLGALEGLHTFDTSRLNKRGKPVDVSSHVGVHIRKELQVNVGRMKSATKRTFNHIAQSKNIYSDSFEEINFRVADFDYAELPPDLYVEDEDIAEKKQSAEVVDYYLHLLTPLQRECLEYKYKMSTSIEEKHKPYVDAIANLALIKLRKNSINIGI